MPETLEKATNNSGNNLKNNGKCSIFPECFQPKFLERCTHHYEITQCPFRERMEHYLTRKQETRS